MPDLLSHALIGYILATLLGVRYDWIDSTYVTVVMAGAFIPDIMKIAIVLPSATVSDAIGMPFEWFALHTLGGATLSILIGVTLVAPRIRSRVGALLGVGAVSHLVADAMLLNVTGRSFPLFWPLSPWRPPSPGLYLSTDPGPAFVLSVIALLVWALKRSTGDTIGTSEPRTR